MTENPWNQQNPQQPAPGHQNRPNYQTYEADATVPLNPHNNYQPGPEHQQNTDYYGNNYKAYAYPQTPAAQEPENKKKHSTRLVLTSALLAALIGGGVGGCAATIGSSSSAPTTALTSSGTTIVNNTDSVNAVTAAAEKATPSVVTIGVTSANETGSGSGIILDNQGHILTNTHVVTLDGNVSNPNIEIKLSDGTVANATIVGTDPTSDLAVIKANTAGLTLTPASLGDSDNLNVGDIAVAIGAPLGLDNTVTDGIISTLSRTIEVASSEAPQGDETGSSQSRELPFQFEIPGQVQAQQPTSTISINVLQTDAAVNPGNSGGALVNSAGEVIGVNVAIASADSGSSSASGNIGVGFSIPINYAKRIAQEIIDNGFATHGYLGASVSTSPANNDSSESFGDGALIQSVVSRQAAAKAGLREGDVIVEFDGRKISEATELTASVREIAPGTTVTAKVQRGSSIEEIEITLGDSADAN